MQGPAYSSYNPILANEHAADVGEQHISDITIDPNPTAAPRVMSNDVLEDVAVLFMAGGLFAGRESAESDQVSAPEGTIHHHADKLRPKQTFQQQSCFYIKAGMLQSCFMASAVQPSVNTGAIASTLTGKKCTARELDCFMAWRGPVSLFVYFDMFCAWYANYRTMLEYLPASFEKTWNMFVNRQMTPLRFSAFILGLTGGIVSFVLNLDSSAALANEWGDIGYAAGIFTLVSGVFSAFSSRFIGSEVMLTILYERLLACLCIDYLYDRLGYKETAEFYQTRRQLIIALSYIYTYEYYISSEILKEFCDKISDYKCIKHLSGEADVPLVIDSFEILVQQTGEELTAYWSVDGQRQHKTLNVHEVAELMDLLPLPSHGSEDQALVQAVASKYEIFRPRYEAAFSLLFADAHQEKKWRGLLQEARASHLGKGLYFSMLAVLAFICISSYYISYNITKAAFPFWSFWPTASYVSALPNTFFYVYSLLFVVDQVIRSSALSQSFTGSASALRWVGFSIACLIALCSSLNLVNTASDQADAGEYNAFGLSPVITKIFFMLIGGLISGLCNLLPILKIDEKYADEAHFKQSQKMSTDINKMITRGDRFDDQKAVARLVEKAYSNYHPSCCSSTFYASSSSSEITAPLIGETNTHGA